MILINCELCKEPIEDDYMGDNGTHHVSCQEKVELENALDVLASRGVTPEMFKHLLNQRNKVSS